ncbi:hypothetical protein BOX15_Mlig018864g1, partial [Macrostomum lignano]
QPPWSLKDNLEFWPSDWQQVHQDACTEINSKEKLVCRNIFMQQLILRNVNSSLSLPLLITAFHSFAYMTFNLLMFPWKQEYHKVRTCTGYYIHTLRHVALHEEVLKCMGYVSALDGNEVQEYQLRPAPGDKDFDDKEWEKQLRRLLLDLLNAEVAVRRLMSAAPTPRDVRSTLESILPQLRQSPAAAAANNDLHREAPIPVARSSKPPQDGQSLRSSHQRQQRPEAKLSIQPAHSAGLPASSRRPAASMSSQPRESRV